MDLKTLTIASALEKMRKKEFSATELTQSILSEIDKKQSLNAYITLTPEKALNQAAESDKHYHQNTPRLLEGIPIAVKDLFCTHNIRTTAGSKMLESFIPPYESTVTARLFSNGGIMTGKTNMDEFAMGSANITSYFGPVKNPLKKQHSTQDLVPGGSSGGSACAVAADMCLGALGSDTGGSVRQPASFTGTVGLKPTYGRCSRYGMIAFASSLDQAGPMTKTVKDAALLLQAIGGFDPMDATSSQQTLPDFSSACTASVKGLKIGIPQEYRVKDMPEEIDHLWQKGIEWLKEAGAEIHYVSLPHTSYALPVYYIIAPAEASSNLARYDGVRYGFRAEGKSLKEIYKNTRGQGFGAEVQKRIMIGTYVLSSGYYDAYYLKAQKIRHLIKEDFKNVFTKVDALLTPSTPGAAFEIGGKQDDPLSMYLNDIFTVTANLAGLPAISVPAGYDKEGLPLGLQLIGRAFDESTILTCGSVIENQSAFLTHAFKKEN